MEENKNELMLWVGILAIIGLFILFMPDIERLIFGRAKKDKDAGTVEKQEEQQVEPQKEEPKVVIPTKYECSLSKTESFYKEDTKFVYTYDKSGNTLTVVGNDTVVVDNADSYNQMKTTYGGLVTMFDKLDAKFKDYYATNIEYDDANRTIKVTSNVKDYSNAMKYISDYNKNHENETIALDVYKNYSDTEINMKSNGYTCK